MRTNTHEGRARAAPDVVEPVTGLPAAGAPLTQAAAAQDESSLGPRLKS